MHQRLCSRLLVVDAQSRVLLFRYEHREGTLSGRQRWTDMEREVVGGSRWWSRTDLIPTEDLVFPEDLAEILVEAGVW